MPLTDEDDILDVLNDQADEHKDIFAVICKLPAPKSATVVKGDAGHGPPSWDTCAAR
jgi:hypothetical protein